MEGRRPHKKRLRAVLLVSAVSAAACGGRAEQTDRDGSSTQRAAGGDDDESVGEVGADLWQSTGDVWVGDVGMNDDCCVDQPVGAGAGNFDVGEMDAPGGAGGESAGSNDYVGIR